jgi:hypothetical protein
VVVGYAFIRPTSPFLNWAKNGLLLPNPKPARPTPRRAAASMTIMAAVCLVTDGGLPHLGCPVEMVTALALKGLSKGMGTSRSRSNTSGNNLWKI